MAPQFDLFYTTLQQQISGIQQQQETTSGTSSNQVKNLPLYLNGTWSYGTSSTGSSGQNAAQLVQQLNNATQSLLSFISSFAGNGAEKQAQAIDSRNTKAAEKLNADAKEASYSFREKVGEVSSTITEHQKVVDNAVKDLEQIQKEIEEQQKALEELVAQIQQKQQELANAQTNEDKQRILGEINEMTVGVTNILSTIQESSKVVANYSEEIETSTKAIEEAKGNAVTIQEDGQMQIQELTQEAAQQTGENAGEMAQGGVNQGAAVTTEASAIAAESSIFTAGIAPKLFRQAASFESAAVIETKGGASNLREVVRGLGQSAQLSVEITNFENSIGKAFSDYNNAIGSWNDKVSPLIESFGSYETVNAGNEELKASVTTDLQTLNSGTAQNSQQTQPVETTQPVQSEKSTTPAQSSDPVQPAEDNTKQQGNVILMTPTFDTNKLKPKMGI